LNSATRGWLLDDTIRRFGFLSAIREVQHVKRTCRECLQLYRRIGKENGSPPLNAMLTWLPTDRIGSQRVKSNIRRVEGALASGPKRAPREFFATWSNILPSPNASRNRRRRSGVPCREVSAVRCQVDSGKTLGLAAAGFDLPKTHRRKFGAQVALPYPAAVGRRLG